MGISDVELCYLTEICAGINRTPADIAIAYIAAR
jgi:hypothetical protein